MGASDDDGRACRPFRMFDYSPAERGSDEPRETYDGKPLSLGQWAGISGAAFSTGLGSRTSLGLSFIAGFFNVRLGFWWDSGVDPVKRGSGATKRSRLGEWFTWALPVQSYLLDEFFARFHGTARRWWYLSDGGHFENTGAYELIRRRLPLIVIIDAGADPDYTCEDLANLVRKVRIDFDAEIEFLNDRKLGKLTALPEQSRHPRDAPREAAGRRTGSGYKRSYFGPATGLRTTGRAAAVAGTCGARGGELREPKQARFACSSTSSRRLSEMNLPTSCTTMRTIRTSPSRRHRTSSSTKPNGRATESSGSSSRSGSSQGDWGPYLTLLEQIISLWDGEIGRVTKGWNRANRFVYVVQACGLDYRVAPAGARALSCARSSKARTTRAIGTRRVLPSRCARATSRPGLLPST